MNLTNLGQSSVKTENCFVAASNLAFLKPIGFGLFCRESISPNSSLHCDEQQLEPDPSRPVLKERVCLEANPQLGIDTSDACISETK